MSPGRFGDGDHAWELMGNEKRQSSVAVIHSGDS